MGTNADAYSDAATQAETARLQQINKLLRKVSKLGLDAKQDQEMQDRLNRLKSLTIFEVARHAASRDEIYEKLQESTEQLRDTKSRLATVETLLADNQNILQRHNSQKFPALKDKALALQTQVDDAKLTYKNYLRTLAKSLIEERRQRLTTYITETYLGMERVENKPSPVAPKVSEKL
jgi:hypothetical protein